MQNQKEKKANLKTSHLFSLKKKRERRTASQQSCICEQPFGLLNTTDIHLRVSIGRDF